MSKWYHVEQNQAQKTPSSLPETARSRMAGNLLLGATAAGIVASIAIPWAVKAREHQ